MGQNGKDNGPRVVVVYPWTSQGTQHSFSSINFCRVINLNRVKKKWILEISYQGDYREAQYVKNLL